METLAKAPSYFQRHLTEKAGHEAHLKDLLDCVEAIRSRITELRRSIDERAGEACCTLALKSNGNCQVCPNDRRGVEYDRERRLWVNLAADGSLTGDGPTLAVG